MNFCVSRHTLIKEIKNIMEWEFPPYQKDIIFIIKAHNKEDNQVTRS